MTDIEQEARDLSDILAVPEDFYIHYQAVTKALKDVISERNAAEQALEDFRWEATRAALWLRAISDWLLTTDNDLKLPRGILDTNPLNIADELSAFILPDPAKQTLAEVTRECEALKDIVDMDAYQAWQEVSKELADFRREVSDEIKRMFIPPAELRRFILPDPVNPRVAALREWLKSRGISDPNDDVLADDFARLEAILAEHGGEVVFNGNDVL